MPKKPDGALLKTDLKFKGRAGVPSSGHSVEKVTLLVDGKETTGFFKPCDPETYPPLLAKYEVAFSIDYQRSLGQQRAPLSKLVYDEKGEIIGSVSIALNNFRSLSTGSVSSDPKIAKYQKPSVELLIDSNAAAPLVAAMLRKEDDGHNGNFGFVDGVDEDGHQIVLFASIDRDMSYWPVTSHIKGKRSSESTAVEPVAEAKLGKLNNRDLVHFPKREHLPHFWPTEPIPLTKSLTKKNPCWAEFTELADHRKQPKFKDQMHMALLIELLSFQPLTLYKRLETEVGGEMPIDLNGYAAIGETQTTKKDKLVARDKGLFLDERGRERTFVDHITRFLTKEYSEFYTAVVLEYESLHTFLANNPTALDKAIKYFTAENKHLPQEKQFDIELIKQTYHKVWRDSARTILTSGAHAILSSIRKLNQFVAADEQLKIKVVETGGQKVLISDESQLLPAKRKSVKYSQAQQCLETLYNEYTKLTLKYNQKETLTLADHSDYVKACHELANQQRRKLLSDEAFKELHEPDKAYILSCFDELGKIIEAVNYQRQEGNRERRNHQTVSYRSTATRGRTGYTASYDMKPTFFKPFIFTPSICKEIQTILANWLCTQSFSDIETQINRAMEIYQSRASKSVVSHVSAAFGWFSSYAAEVVNSSVTDRSKAIKELIKATKETVGVSKLAKEAPLTLIMDIFSDGGWKENSFNTELLARILPIAVNKTAISVDELSKYPNIKDIQRAIDSVSSWKGQAEIIAKGISTTFNKVLLEVEEQHAAVARH